MIRRSFLSHLGKAAAAGLSPTILGASSLARSTNDFPVPPAYIANGSSALRFLKRPSGLRLELSIRQDSQWRRVASVQNPVRIFYDRRGNGSEKDRSEEHTSELQSLRHLV